MAKLTIGCFPGLVGNMTYDFALKFGEAARDKGHDVDIWFSGNATGSVKANQKHLKDYSTGETHLKRLMEKGIRICTCEACTVARGIKKDDAVPGVLWSAMHWYLASCHAADRVLLIGGE
jgi:tRNA 2-thiouridine synthesizing protein D